MVYADVISSAPLSPTLFGNQEMGNDAIGIEEIEIESTTVSEVRKTTNYVSQSAVALRCRVMPPPCFKNPYLKDASQMEIDPFGNQRSKCAAFIPEMMDGNGLSRYRADFHEIEQIGIGNFSHVFKILNRIGGCLYAVKQSIRQLHMDTERRKALMEVQCLAALGSHANIVRYYTSWFENERAFHRGRGFSSLVSEHPWLQVQNTSMVSVKKEALWSVMEVGSQRYMYIVAL